MAGDRLGGLGNTDKYFENVTGKPLRALALRLFDPATRLWSIYWVDGSRGTMDPPVVGSFANGVGHFFGKDTYQGKPIVVVFRWDVRKRDAPVWSQAFSADGGKTWEGNSINVSQRIFGGRSERAPRRSATFRARWSTRVDTG
jgi:hypothetical protein